MNRRKQTAVAIRAAGVPNTQQRDPLLLESMPWEFLAHPGRGKSESIRVRAVQSSLGLGQVLPFEEGILRAAGYFRYFLRIPA